MQLIGTDAVIVAMATGADSAPAGLARGDAAASRSWPPRSPRTLIHGRWHRAYQRD